MSDRLFGVEVVYATPAAQTLLALRVPPGTTLIEVLRLSGLAARYPELDAEGWQLGVHGRLLPADTCVSPGDRVEVYRPLIIDPKAARRARAKARAGRR